MPSSADIQANMVVELHELPDSDSDSGSATSSVIASGFMAMELDPAGCRHQQGKCDDGGPIGGVGGLALQAGDNFDSVLHSETHLDVGDDTKSRIDLIREGVDSETYDRHLRAWFFFSQAFDLPIDLGRFSRSKSPGKFREDTVK